MNIRRCTARVIDITDDTLALIKLLEPCNGGHDIFGVIEKFRMKRLKNELRKKTNTKFIALISLFWKLIHEVLNMV